MTSARTAPVATAVIVATVARARRAGSKEGQKTNGNQRPHHLAGPPSLPAPPEDLPVLGPERAQDRLQGRASPAALRLRARQDRALAHHRGFGLEAAPPRPGDQARPLHRHHALLGLVSDRTERWGGGW